VTAKTILRDPTYSQAVSQSMIDSGERARGHQFIGVMIQVVRYEDSSSGRCLEL